MYDYTVSKIIGAVDTLNTGKESIRERLELAYMLDLNKADPDHLPENLRKRLQAIHDALTSVKAKGDEGGVHATIITLSEIRCEEIAREINTICAEL